MLSILLAIIVIFLISISNAGKGHQTPSPTTSPVTQVCRFPDDDYDLDLMVLVDTSCKMTTAQCKNQQEEVAETVTAVRGNKTLIKSGIRYNQVRVGYIEYGSTNVTVKIDLEHDPINLNVDDPSESRMQLYYEIRDSSTACNDDLESRTGSGNLYDALAEAINEFESGTVIKSDDIQQDKKILIFTNCPVDENERTRICDQYEDWIRTGSKSSQRGDNQAGDGINVVMVNNVISTETFTDPDEYIYCLVEYDDGRIFTQSVDDDDYATDVLPNVQDEICDYPTPAPTTDPTTDPTSDPTNGNTPTTPSPTFCPREGCDPTRAPIPVQKPPSVPPPGVTDATDLPTPSPTTPSPVTPAPTTTEPTTIEPTTSAPTTSSPTTSSPTTSSPTTTSPSPITPSPTTSSPTSSSPTTPSPVTTPSPTTPSPVTFPPTTPTLQPVRDSPTRSPATSQPTKKPNGVTFNITEVTLFSSTEEPCPEPPSCDGTCVALIILCILVCCCCGLLIGAILYREREEKKKGYGSVPQEYEQEATVEYSASEAQAVVAAYDDDGNEAQQLVAAYDDDQPKPKPEPAVTPYKD